VKERKEKNKLFVLFYNEECNEACVSEFPLPQVESLSPMWPLPSMNQRVKQHHENHKHESFYLTPSLLLDITCNPKHELELDLWKYEKIRKEKLQVRKGKKMACVKPYEKM